LNYKLRIIPVNKPTQARIIISTLEVIHPNLGIIIIPTVSEGIHIAEVCGIVGNVQAIFVFNGNNPAPGVVGISCNQDTVGILDSDDVTLQVLMEIICRVVVDDTANRVLVVIQRNQGTVAPGFLQDLGTVELVGVQYTVNRLACSDAVSIIGVFDVVERLKLASLFPSQIMTEVGDGVAQVIIDNRHVVGSSQLVLPGTGVLIPIRHAIGGLGEDVAIVVIGHGVDNHAIDRLGQKLSLGVVGILSHTVNCVGYLGDALFLIILVCQGAAIFQGNLLHQVGGGRGLQILGQTVPAGNTAVVIRESAVHEGAAKLQLVILLAAELIVPGLGYDTRRQSHDRVASLGIGVLVDLLVTACVEDDLLENLTVRVVEVGYLHAEGLGGDVIAGGIEGYVEFGGANHSAVLIVIIILFVGRFVNTSDDISLVAVDVKKKLRTSKFEVRKKIIKINF